MMNGKRVYLINIIFIIQLTHMKNVQGKQFSNNGKCLLIRNF